jgi:hypothetical protein
MTAISSRREPLPDRRRSFELGRFADGRVGEIFLSNHKANRAADTAARDSAIVASIALRHGADLDTIRKALCRASHCQPSGPLGTALDLIAEEGGG